VPGIHSICPHPARAGDLVLGISCGGAWVTHDDGASWQLQADGMRAAYMPPEQAGSPNTQDPHRIVRCAAQPDVLWTQHHNGIWRSTDVRRELAGGDRPRRCRTSASRSACIRTMADRVVRAGRGRPARVPVGRRAGGQPHARRRAGASRRCAAACPSRHCYDLVYRHGLAVCADGRTLLIGSTTAACVGSFDGGDSWHTVSNTLPPIYAVRFG
jgi:hypothetical protein